VTGAAPRPGATHVAVVGGGVSGLAAAHRLRAVLGPTARITLLERTDRLGGVLRTVELAGVPFDMGAEAFLFRRPELVALAGELGLAVVHPSAATPSLRVAGRTVGLPAQTLFGVPGSAARLDGVLEPAACARVATEADHPLDWTPGADAVLGTLLRDRFGDQVADRLADPVLGGVYAGRVDALGLRATVPPLAGALDAGAGSLTAAVDTVLAAPVRPGLPVFGAFVGGYAVLLEALRAAGGADVRLATTVRELRRGPHGWRLVLGPATAEQQLDVDAVVLAAPAAATARLLGTVCPAAAQAAREIQTASSVVVALAYPGHVTLPPTSGVLVGVGEPLSVKALTCSTRKWAHLAPDGLVRLRASLGRFGEAESLQVEDTELVARVRSDLAVLAGVRAEPVAVRVQRWGGGLPQYEVGHLDRVRTIEDGLPPGLAVAGAALHGIGVPACVATACAAAERVAAAVAGAPGPARSGSMAAWPVSTTPR